MARWFAKKKASIDAGECVFDHYEKRIETLRAWRNVGQEFEYFGRRMVVVKHGRIEFIAGCVVEYPELHARYVDDHGVVRDIVLSEVEVLSLANAQSKEI